MLNSIIQSCIFTLFLQIYHISIFSYLENKDVRCNCNENYCDINDYVVYYLHYPHQGINLNVILCDLALSLHNLMYRNKRHEQYLIGLLHTYNTFNFKIGFCSNTFFRILVMLVLLNKEK